MTTRRVYQIAESRLTIEFGSVLDVPAEAVVSSDDYRLTMGGGVSAAIRAAAGNALLLDAAKAVPREAGDVVVTTAGALAARYVFHVITIGPDYWADPPTDAGIADLVRGATRACLKLMPPLGVRSIAFPALGTGTAGYPMEASAAAMAEVIHDVLSQDGGQLDVSIMLMSRTPASPMQYVAFYEEFARRVPVVAARETARDTAPPQSAPARAQQPIVSDLLGIERRRIRLEQELGDLRQDGGDSARENELRRDIALNTEERVTVVQREQSRRLKAAKVFISYARQDEQLRNKLWKNLGGLRTGGYISGWSDDQIIAGQEWEDEIIRRLDESDIVLLLVTENFLGSEFIGRVERPRALERHSQGEVIVIPVILRDVYWKIAGLEEFQALPKGGKAVSTWDNQDTAYKNIAEGLVRTVDAWRDRHD
jgi:O-acetyl-ADP-ribose deacetylase (regulator of RNase III)